MSTQAAQSIRFTQTHPQQRFKLLELPPDLFELLSSDDAPILELKCPSAAYRPPKQNGPSIREYVNLCTPTKTYRIRQVQSSNSIHIIKPAESDVLNKCDPAEPDNDVALEDVIDTRLTTIAKCGSTLELHIPPEGFPAIQFLESSLRVYDRLSSDGTDVGKGYTSRIELHRMRSIKEAMLSDIPFSRAQCEAAWTEVCAFVHDDGAGGSHRACWRPSSMVKIDVWKRILGGAVLQGIDLERQFLVKDLWKSMLDEDLYDAVGEAPFPITLFEAILGRVCDSQMPNGQGSEFMCRWTNVDKDRCTQWVGETFLEAMAPMASEAIAQVEFLRDWKDLLPERWRNDVALSKLSDGIYKRPDPVNIYFTGNSQLQALDSNLSTASEASAAKKSRNWHELFRNQKR